ncbi:MAG: hypothetical protein PHN92_03915 [Geobacter sp.]|nr:hypothetical protein [Geobacter sp.]
MKKIIVLLASVALFSGCASTETIKRLESQHGQGAFQVVDASAKPLPDGYGDLKISLNVKTRPSNAVLINTTGYGTERYQLLIGINGQTQRLVGKATLETGEYRRSIDPEAGNGVRYVFETTLRLPVGLHKVTFALPGDGVVLEQALDVKLGENQMVLQPVYRSKNPHQRIGFNGDTTYYEGVKRLRIKG